MRNRRRICTWVLVPGQTSGERRYPMTEQSVRSVCWPEDPDYLDGKTEIELPPERYTKVFWDADILDLDDKNQHDTIIGTEELFDVGFKPIGPGGGFYLSSLLPGATGFEVKGWRGCDTLCIEQVVTVPPGTIKIEGDTEVYEVAAKVELRCCDGHVAVAGYEALEEYEFFKGA